MPLKEKEAKLYYADLAHKELLGVRALREQISKKQLKANEAKEEAKEKIEANPALAERQKILDDKKAAHDRGRAVVQGVAPDPGGAGFLDRTSVHGCRGAPRGARRHPGSGARNGPQDRPERGEAEAPAHQSIGNPLAEFGQVG